MIYIYICMHMWEFSMAPNMNTPFVSQYKIEQGNGDMWSVCF